MKGFLILGAVLVFTVGCGSSGALSSDNKTATLPSDAFPTSNAKISNIPVGNTDLGTELIGEIENKSARDCGVAIFTATLYDKEGGLLDTEKFIVNNFPAGAKRTFEVSFLDLPFRKVQGGSFKIDVDACQ